MPPNVLVINSPRIYPAENFLRRMDRPTRIELVLKHLIRLAFNLKNAGNDDLSMFLRFLNWKADGKMEPDLSPLGLLGNLAERFKRGLQPLQPATHRLSGSANPDAEVFRSLEEFSWHHAGVERVAQGSH